MQKEFEKQICDSVLSFSNDTAQRTLLAPVIENINSGDFSNLEALSFPLLIELLALWLLHMGVLFKVFVI